MFVKIYDKFLNNVGSPNNKSTINTSFRMSLYSAMDRESMKIPDLSFLPNNRCFGNVKKKRGDRYHHPMELCQLIFNAHIKFTISIVTSEDIVDFRS